MAIMAPPQRPPRVALSDDDGLSRLHSRLRLLGLTTITILITTWLVSLETVPAILALVVAKHVLVAILALTLGVDAGRRAEV